MQGHPDSLEPSWLEQFHSVICLDKHCALSPSLPVAPFPLCAAAALPAPHPQERFSPHGAQEYSAQALREGPGPATAMSPRIYLLKSAYFPSTI